MDRAIKVAWYDLPDAGRAGHLEWLHTQYLPALLERPGYAWAAHYGCVDNQVPAGRVRHAEDAALGRGNAYVLIVAAADAHVFVHQAAPDDERLKLRGGERTQIFTEEARLDGPAAAKREGELTPAPCIQIGSFCTAHYRDDEEVLNWYVQNRMAAMRDTPGCLGVRKYVSVTGWARHGVLYEFESLAIRHQYFMQRANARPEDKVWSDKLVPSLIHAPGSPNVAVRLWVGLANSRGHL